MPVLLDGSILRRRLRRGLGAASFIALLLFAAWPWLPLPGAEARPRTLVFYGFSILGDTMERQIFPAFQASWAQRTGERVDVVGSFAGSGTITNQLIMGVPADVALLSLELDAWRLADAGVIRPADWQGLPHGGVVNRTPFILLVRPGNPKGIHDFADLARPGIGVVHPDPLTSGAANWAIVAEYGAGAREAGGSAEAGYALLAGIWRNVVAQAPSARSARTQFENGFGDVLVTYEQEALVDRARGRLAAEIIYPKRTILSEHTLVRVTKNVDRDEEELVNGFVRFLWSDTAQRGFVSQGFRSVDERLNAANPAFGRIEDPFLISDYGGWARAKADIVDALWRQRVLPAVAR